MYLLRNNILSTRLVILLLLSLFLSAVAVVIIGDTTIVIDDDDEDDDGKITTTLSSSSSSPPPSNSRNNNNLKFWKETGSEEDEEEVEESAKNAFSAGLTYKLYDNGAMAYQPTKQGITLIAQLSLKKQDPEGGVAPCFLSGEILGTINFINNNNNDDDDDRELYEFQCQFNNTSTGFVWIDGHLICTDHNSYRPDFLVSSSVAASAASASSFSSSHHYQGEEPSDRNNPLPITNGFEKEPSDNPLPIGNRPLPFRAHITNNDTACDGTENAPAGTVQVFWRRKGNNNNKEQEEEFQLLQHHQQQGHNGNADHDDGVLTTHLSRNLPPGEERRDRFQRKLGYGFGSWLRHDMMSIVKLPEGLVVTPKLCRTRTTNTTTNNTSSTTSCMDVVSPESREVRVGLHTYDRSYVTYTVGTTFSQQQQGGGGNDDDSDSLVNVTIEYSVVRSTNDTNQQEAVYFLITPTALPPPNSSSSNATTSDNYEIRLYGRYGWYRPGTVSVSTSTTTTTTANRSGEDQQQTMTFTTPGLGVSKLIVATAATTEDDDINDDDLELNNKKMKTERKRRTLGSSSPHLVRDDGDGGDDDDDDDDFLRLPLTKVGQSVGFGIDIGPTSTTTLTTKEIADKINTNKQFAEKRIRTKFGTKSNVAQVIISTVMWTLIYNPVENHGLFMPVTRGDSWSFQDSSGAATADWMYIIFDWDNLFASLLAGLDNKDVAYSNLFQVIKSKTAAGFVPNFSTGGYKTQDRTEPAIGAKVMLELYRKYNETWPVEVVFDDLVDWNNWFLDNRVLDPSGLIALGSHAAIYNHSLQHRHRRDGLRDDENMQAARYESGMDNSPMYDGNFFDKESHLMQLYDVGMSSLFVQEAYSLAELAGAIGRQDEGNMLKARGDAMRDKIRSELWDPKQQLFVNKFPNGTFSNRISPTSFYPLLIGAATEEQAQSMTYHWLLNSSRFCISPNGDFDGNDPDGCYYGLPSISADDPAFMVPGANHYWRGLVWGPLAQLVYWSLQEASFLSSQSNDKEEESRLQQSNLTLARKALCQQMEALLMSQWNAHRHICENFHPSLNRKGRHVASEGGGSGRHSSAGNNNDDCTGTKFYHWGSLTGLIGMMEDGYWYNKDTVAARPAAATGAQTTTTTVVDPSSSSAL